MGLFVRPARRPVDQIGRGAGESFDQQEARAIAEFSRHFGITFHDPELLRLALTHRSYLSVTGMGPRESNERLEFLGDSVLGLVTSEYLYRKYPDEHEGQLTKTKSLLVSKAILSRRALSMGLGRFVLMSHSEVESGGRQRLSILADAFESVLGAIYLDQGFEEARRFVEYWLLRGSREIVADKRHRNYKSHLQEYVQSTFRTHPVYRIRSQMGPDHSKLFLVEVMVARRVLGEGRGSNKKEAEQAAARDALERVERPGERRDEPRERRPDRGGREDRESRELRPDRAGREDRESRELRPDRGGREDREPRELRPDRAGREDRESRELRPDRAGREDREPRPSRESREPRGGRVAEVAPATGDPSDEGEREGRRGRRGRRRRTGREAGAGTAAVERTTAPAGSPGERYDERPEEVEPRPSVLDEDDVEEVGRPEGPLQDWRGEAFEPGAPAVSAESPEESEPEATWESEPESEAAWEPEPEREGEPEWEPEEESEPEAEPHPATGPVDEGEPPYGTSSEEAGPGPVSRGEGPEAGAEAESGTTPQFGRRRARRR